MRASVRCIIEPPVYANVITGAMQPLIHKQQFEEEVAGLS